MAGICWLKSPFPIMQPIHRRNKSFGCCSNKNKKRLNPSPSTPQPLKAAVSALTELLRFFSTKYTFCRSETVEIAQKSQVSLSSIDDVLRILKSDYENAYFVTGIFTSKIYSEDCLFEDPTIQFRGTELYARNLKLLVPFFDHPSIALQKMVKDTEGERNYVLATWELSSICRTYPWWPLISINGTTAYDLDDNFKVVKHAESWDVSALQAIGQIFTPNFGRSGG